MAWLRNCRGDMPTGGVSNRVTSFMVKAFGRLCPLRGKSTENSGFCGIIFSAVKKEKNDFSAETLRALLLLVIFFFLASSR